MTNGTSSEGMDELLCYRNVGKLLAILAGTVDVVADAAATVADVAEAVDTLVQHISVNRAKVTKEEIVSRIMDNVAARTDEVLVVALTAVEETAND